MENILKLLAGVALAFATLMAGKALTLPADLGPPWAVTILVAWALVTGGVEAVVSARPSSPPQPTEAVPPTPHQPTTPETRRGTAWVPFVGVAIIGTAAWAAWARIGRARRCP